MENWKAHRSRPRVTIAGESLSGRSQKNEGGQGGVGGRELELVDDAVRVLGLEIESCRDSVGESRRRDR